MDGQVNRFDLKPDDGKRLVRTVARRLLLVETARRLLDAGPGSVIGCLRAG
jgi:hypothetical protein